MIVKFGSPILRIKSTDVENFSDPSLHHIIAEMQDELAKTTGIAIAAPQIGYDKRIVVIKHPTTVIMVNPKIVWSSDDMYQDMEGCLSYPGYYGLVNRHKRIEVQYHDQHGVAYEETYTSLMARCVQHEIDHLDGIVFTDKVIGRVLRHKTTQSLVSFNPEHIA
jgi:peptide deformylase